MCFIHCDVPETFVIKGMGQGWGCDCCVTETAVQNVSDTTLSFKNIKSFQKQRSGCKKKKKSNKNVSYKVWVVVFIKANMIKTELRQPKMVSLSLVESFDKGKHVFSQLWKCVRPVIFCKMHVWPRPDQSDIRAVLLMRGLKLLLVAICSASVRYDWVWKHATGLEKSCQIQLSSFDFLSATKCLADNYHSNISTHENANERPPGNPS